MIENINKFEKILQSFKFKQPVPLEIQKRILYFKRKTVVNALKHFGEYNVFYGSVLRFHFFTKRVGINLTAWQSELVLLLFSIVTAVSALAGILIMSGLIVSSAKNISILDKKDTLFDGKRTYIEKTIENIHKEQTRKETATKNRLGIQGILSDKENAELASGITDKLYILLKNEKSPENVIYRKTDGIDKSVNKLLMGRLNKIGSTYLLSISIADAETGKLLYDKNYSFREIDEIDKILNQAAESIMNDNEIW